MLDAADILIDGQPAANHLRIERLVRRRRREAQKIPAGIDESVERVGLAHRFAAARRALDVLPRRMETQRIAGNRKIGVLGQYDGKLALRDRKSTRLKYSKQCAT